MTLTIKRTEHREKFSLLFFAYCRANEVDYFILKIYCLDKGAGCC